MTEDSRSEVTRILDQILRGKTDGQQVQRRLFELVYDELRNLAGRLMRGERAGHTLQPTALVHEAYMRLADHPLADWKGRAHFLGIAARAMRQILIEHARRRDARKRGGGLRQVTLDESLEGMEDATVDLLALDEALTGLSSLDPRMEKVVELRVFGGLNMDEIAHLLLISRRTAYNDWDLAKHWLAVKLAEGSE
jgi:RNA polymerase sigma-70 factor (ECF subfamily)